ncbi:tRNA preQ1(34) S-adenosylmethionine ribosyltransferase-isomerase QueA [Patescibacteria group bacterium]|nr:tRNA preQ1(34) S-adenosylmethionine ribosyltransferase-isomerase QueA [Patescibacteria group bacterium]
MLTKDFRYDLPRQSIAQSPVTPRDSSKLLVLDCKKQQMDDKIFTDIVDYLNPGDLIVVNDSKVFKARLRAKKGESLFEIFLLRPVDGLWSCLAKPGKKLKIGDTIKFADDLEAKIEQKNIDGTVLIKFPINDDSVFNFANEHGEVPTPPYVDKAPADFADYQTIYAEKTGSAAAPTAGFHFTEDLINKIKNKGIQITHVTLHVGLGTFRPVMTENIEDHDMHEEWIEVTQETIDLIKETKLHGGSVIAVGTTSVRSLESAARIVGTLKPYCGFTKLFIKPGDDFMVIDAMITNFHLPESTLIMLVSAFAQSKMNEPDAGRKFILQAYEHAIKLGYRFYSFGDAMLII